MNSSKLHNLAPLFLASILTLMTVPLTALGWGVKPQACSSENAQACWERADELDTQGEYEKAVEFYQRLCELDFSKGCGRLGWAYQEGEGIESNLSKAERFLKKGCDLNDGRACNNLGVMHEKKMAETPSIRMANTLYQKSCDLEDIYGCYNIGYNLIEGLGTEFDLEKGMEMYRRGCEFGDPDQCESVADYYDDQQDFALAFGFYAKACDLESGYGCNRVGWAYDYGEGVNQDITLANQFYEKSCNLDFGWGCNNLARGFMHWDEIDTNLKRDYKRGLELFKTACELGAAMGCNGAGYIYDSALGVAQDYELANHFFVTGCDVLDDPVSSACYNLAKNYEEGNGVKKSRKQARAYYRKACDLGEEDAC